MAHNESIDVFRFRSSSTSVFKGGFRMLGYVKGIPFQDPSPKQGLTQFNCSADVPTNKFIGISSLRTAHRIVLVSLPRVDIVSDTDDVNIA